jgi:quinoprotein glucose dehydrogenase
VIYINANDLPWTGGLTETTGAGGLGQSTYQAQCSACHGADRQGFPPAFPSLIDRAAQLREADVEAVVRNGKGRMPAFPFIAGGPALKPLIAYVLTGAEPPAERSDKAEVVAPGPAGTPPPRFRFTGYRKFLDPEGYPAVVPPWGTLNAIDLATGRYLWRIPLGEYPELAAQGLKDTGTENYGGPVVTAGGLVIIGATNFDSRLRAFDSRDGKLLWQAALPYAGNATPATYMVDGRQYVVIAASNGRNPKGPQGSAYVAFALPEPEAPPRR